MGWIDHGTPPPQTYVDAYATIKPLVEESRKARQNELQAEGQDITPCLILSVSENGFGKRTDVEEYRLQTRGGSGVINMKAPPRAARSPPSSSSTTPASS